MEPERFYGHLEELMHQLGITLRYENLGNVGVPVQSGLCNIKGRLFFIMDRSESLSEKIRLLTACLNKMNLDGVYIKPAVRERLTGKTMEGDREIPKDKGKG